MGGLVDLEDPDPGPDLWPAVGKAVQTSAEDDVLPNAAVHLLLDQSLDESGVRNDGRREGSQPSRGAASSRPIVVFEYVRRLATVRPAQQWDRARLSA